MLVQLFEAGKKYFGKVPAEAIDDGVLPAPDDCLALVYLSDTADFINPAGNLVLPAIAGGLISYQPLEFQIVEVCSTAVTDVNTFKATPGKEGVWHIDAGLSMAEPVAGWPAGTVRFALRKGGAMYRIIDERDFPAAGSGKVLRVQLSISTYFDTSTNFEIVAGSTSATLSTVASWTGFVNAFYARSNECIGCMG